MKHVHRWGAELRRTKYRFCINGWCPMAQSLNGRTFMARPERRAQEHMREALRG